MKELIERLSEIQRTLNAPKTQFNSFGKYSYRNCEDILQAVKPLLKGDALTVSDEIIMVGDRFYVRATATFYHADLSHSVSAFARESFDKKGMDSAQITGSTSSYARKYALNGLLLIDDNKDPDSKDNSQQSQVAQPARGAPHVNSKEGQAIKAEARNQSSIYATISGHLANVMEYDYAAEALAEITDENEKQNLWKLFTQQEKEIIRSLKVL